MVLPDYNSRDQQQDEGVWYYLYYLITDYNSRDQQQDEDEGVRYYLITIVVISSRMRVCGIT